MSLKSVSVFSLKIRKKSQTRLTCRNCVFKINREKISDNKRWFYCYYFTMCLEIQYFSEENFFVKIPYFWLITVSFESQRSNLFRFDLFSSTAKYSRRQFLLGASPLALGTTDWNLQNPDSVFMGSMRILSISTWTRGFGITLARRPRACSTCRETADRIRRIHGRGY